MIDQRDFMEIITRVRGEAIVVSTMTAIGAWQKASNRPERDMPLTGGMGKASSLALGIALARPDIKVIVLDGDGSLLMNLGSLVTVAGKAPSNFYHFVLENGVYAITGGQPIPGAHKISFSGLANAAGYANSYEFDDLEEFASNIGEILAEPGPNFICLKTVPELQQGPDGQTTVQAIPAVMRAIGTAG
jgi:sulfopyruvate decarboxylase subunit beta